VSAQTIQGRQLGRHLPSRVTQLTLHAGTVGAPKSESFTFLLKGGRTPLAEMKVGRVVAVELSMLEVVGLDKLWIADEVTLVDNPFRPT